VLVKGGIKLESYKEGAERFYDLFGEKDDIDFYVEQAKSSGSKALELGIGTARLAIHLARAGIETWGIEPSMHMIRAAEKNISEEDIETQLRLHLVQGDARSFRLSERFGLIYFPSCSFDHILYPTDQKAALVNIRNHLISGGRYIFDLYIAKELESDNGWFVQRKELPDGSKVIRSGYHTTKPETRLMSLDIWYDHVVEGRVIERFYEGSDVYIHDVETVRELLDDTGYEIIEEYGNHYYKPYEKDDNLIVFVTIARN
jgi:ubiquinone/menaquinone biosynthesis C-methylase UbiE